MKLYHPSNKKFNIVKTKYFSEHYYTQNDYRASGLRRTFWYLTPDIPEDRFKNVNYIYMIDIDKHKLYDLRKDPEKLLDKYYMASDLLHYISKHYIGVIYKPTSWNLVAIFKDMKPKKIIERKW